MINNEKILVLGGTGHYGRHIVKALIKQNQNVRVLSRNVPKAREILGWKPKYTLNKALEITLKWYRDYFNGK